MLQTFAHVSDLHLGAFAVGLQHAPRERGVRVQRRADAGRDAGFHPLPKGRKLLAEQREILARGRQRANFRRGSQLAARAGFPWTVIDLSVFST